MKRSKKEQKLMSDFDRDKYYDAFCKKEKCNACYGTDFNGEPNGYGCLGLEKRIDNMYISILNRRMKNLCIREKDIVKTTKK